MWSAPDTRKKLLEGLAEKGFSKEPLAEMQKTIEAENSDLFDVNDRQQAFLDFVMAQYVSQGVEELDADKLTPLLRL